MSHHSRAAAVGATWPILGTSLARSFNEVWTLGVRVAPGGASVSVRSDPLAGISSGVAVVIVSSRCVFVRCQGSLGKGRKIAG